MYAAGRPRFFRGGHRYPLCNDPQLLFQLRVCGGAPPMAASTVQTIDLGRIDGVDIML